MSGMLPVQVYGLEVPAGDVMIPAAPDFPATFRITMAALDPSAVPQHVSTMNGDSPARATLKLVRSAVDTDDESDSEDGSNEEDFLSALLGEGGSEDDDEDMTSGDDEKNGGPSDPSKSKKARREAALEQLKKALAENNSNDEMAVEGTNGTNGTASKAKKGKAKAVGGDDDQEIDEEIGNGGKDLEVDEFVLCTLDPLKNYQQTLDITVIENEHVFFKVSGTHTVYLTGNYVIPADEEHDHQHEIYDGDREEGEYDLSPDEGDLGEFGDESDELDGLEDPRVTEIASDDDLDAPKLVLNGRTTTKGKNKRAAEESEDEPANLDEIMEKSLKRAESAPIGETKLGKKQLKKQKNNSGNAIERGAEKKSDNKEQAIEKDSSSAKSDKKVQFAKNLEQGPSGEKKQPKTDDNKVSQGESKKDVGKSKETLGVKIVNGVKIDVKTLGKGPAAKKGDKVGMRYIGKLQDGKVFDANKKGKPFAFKLGAGEVIKGWDIGVEGMSIGSERRITVPANLAYGKKSMPGIPSNSDLIFDVKLLEIQ